MAVLLQMSYQMSLNLSFLIEERDIIIVPIVHWAVRVQCKVISAKGQLVPNKCLLQLSVPLKETLLQI